MRFEYGVPGEIDAPIRNWAPLRASGSMRYLDFIRSVKNLWEEGHPDVPIFPTQGKNFARYPCIVYSLQMRKTHQVEPKARIRDTLEDDDGQLYKITAQRFDNVVLFTAITENEPELCETFRDSLHRWSRRIARKPGARILP